MLRCPIVDLRTAKAVLEKEAKALLDFSKDLSPAFSDVCEKILQLRGTVLVTGMGKSGIVARKWASTFSSTGTRAYFINPAEAPHGDLGIIGPEDILMVLSNSGETEELSFLLEFAKTKTIPIVGITQNLVSSLATSSDFVLEIPKHQEAEPLNLAPTTSTTLMMALGDALAVTLMQEKKFTERDFASLHPAGTLGKRYARKVKQLMHQGEEIPKVQSHYSISAVLIEMTSKRLGLAVVFDRDTQIGIVTDGDLRRFFQKNGLKENATAKDMMSANPKAISEEALAYEARLLMEKNQIQQLLVSNSQGELTGILHFHDLLKAKII